MFIYEISHTLNSLPDYVGAESPNDAVEKLKSTYIHENIEKSRLEDKDILSVTKLGDLIL